MGLQKIQAPQQPNLLSCLKQIQHYSDEEKNFNQTE